MPTLALVVSLPAECSDANDQIKSGTNIDQVPIIEFFSYMMLTLMLAVGCWVSASVEAAEVSPVQSFVSRPDILAPVLNVRSVDHASVSKGYILLSTWEGDAQNGPYIYTNDGDLVWSGHDRFLPKTEYFNFQSHHLSNGSSILSVFRGFSDNGRGEGHVALLDSSYQVLRTIESPSTHTSLDFHEFDLLDDGQTAIVVSFQPYQGELSRFDVTDGLGWLLDSVFYLLNITSGEMLMEWKASEHIPIEESTVRPSIKIGAGLSYRYAFDWLFQKGDFLLSARHTDALYRINGIDGSIIWKLGGSQSSFKMHDFNFSAQHDARIVDESHIAGKLVISLYNNGFNGQTQTHEASSAMILELDEQTMTARVIRRMFPSTLGLAQNTGSMQPISDNGNYLVSWGQMKGCTGFTELDQHGKMVLDVAFGDPSTRNYRVRKADWIGDPNTRPDLYLYSRDGISTTHFWMSWNGATEVAAWRVGQVQSQGLSQQNVTLGIVGNEGFETHFETDQFTEEGYVEALDRDQRVLGRSDRVRVFVPPSTLASSCPESHCRKQMLHATERKDAATPPMRTLMFMPVGSEWMTSVLLLVFGYALGRLRLWIPWPSRSRR